MTEHRKTFQTATTEIVNMQQTGKITDYEAAIKLGDIVDDIVKETAE